MKKDVVSTNKSGTEAIIKKNDALSDDRTASPGTGQISRRQFQVVLNILCKSDNAVCDLLTIIL